MDQKSLTGLEWLGYAYNCAKSVAASSAVNTRQHLFQFVDDESVEELVVYRKSYSVPSRFEVTLLENNKLPADHVAQVEGIREPKRFEEKYRNSADFFHLVQFGLLEAYQASLPPVETLKNHLNPAFAEVLNGTLPGKEVVRKWGTHFLHGGVFGGRLAYSQSVSRFAVEDIEEAKMQVAANYQVFIHGSLYRNVQKDAIETSEQSNAHFDVVGGDSRAFRGDWQGWARTVEAGKFDLIGLGSSSLVAISELALDPVRRQELEDAIREQLENGEQDLKSIRWDKLRVEKQRVQAKGGEVFLGDLGALGAENRASISLEHDHELVVGVSMSPSNVAVKVLNLQDNTQYWVGTPDEKFKVDASPVARGAVLVGLGLNDTPQSPTVCYYQLLSPIKEKPNPAFLNRVIQPVYGGDPMEQYELEFQPEPTEGKVIVGIDIIRDGEGKLTGMELLRAPLKQTGVQTQKPKREELPGISRMLTSVLS